MPRFYVDERDFIQAVELPDIKHVFAAIRENNDGAEIWYDPINYRFVVECENQPRDMALFNIFWKLETPPNKN